MVIPEIPAWLSYEAQKLAYSRPSGSVFWTSKRRLEHRISTTYVPHDLKYIHLVTSDHLKFSRPPWKVMLPATTLSASTPSPEGPGASSPGLSLIFLNQGSGFRADVCSCSPHPTTQDSFWSLWLAQLFLLGMLVALPEMHPTPPHPIPGLALCTAGSSLSTPQLEYPSSARPEPATLSTESSPLIIISPLFLSQATPLICNYIFPLL